MMPPLPLHKKRRAIALAWPAPQALRRPNAASRPTIETLESRALLSASADTFAQLSGNVAAPNAQGTVAIHVNRGDFNMPGGRVLLGFAMQAPTAPAGSAEQMTMHGADRRSHVSTFALGSGGGTTNGSALLLARAGTGTFNVNVGASPSALGPFQLDVTLVGDANGDHKVDRTDLALIRKLRGQRIGDARYLLAADPDRDGVVNGRDLALAQMNLGASTRVRPLAATLGLDPATDPDGNGIVMQPNVVLDGHTQPGAVVHLIVGSGGVQDQTTRANGQGTYQFHVIAPQGITPVEVVAADGFGQQTTAQLNIMRGDVVIAWISTTIDAIRADLTTLGLTTRTYGMVSAAMYDAVNDILRTGAVYHVDVPAPAGASPEAAAAQAAHDVLLSLYPAQKARFDASLAESLQSLNSNPTAIAEGEAVGQQVAAGIIAWRANDGSSRIVPYIPGNQPGQWRPTPPDFSAPWGPEWGQVTPFAIPSATPFLPPPPPPLDSPAYTAAFNEVKSLGELNSTTRTPQQTETGIFWGYDVPKLGLPLTHYEEIAQDVALQQGNTLAENARLFALIGIAMADSGIVTWDTKFTDNFWRPVTAIPLAGTDGNPNTVADPTWTPLGAPGDGKPNFTPPFPAYVSGHAAFGAAMFQTLANFYGTDNIPFTIGSDELPGVFRTYTSFSQAAEENGQSRIYLGIHWNFDKVQGIAVGNSVANFVFQHDLTPNP